MATYSVQYVDGYGLVGGGDREKLDADGFRLDGDGTWMDFLDGDDNLILRVRAEDVLRIELVAATTATAVPEEFEIEEEELAG